MKSFATAHATHPDWKVALRLVEAQLASHPGTASATLGWAYFTDHYAPHAEELAAALRVTYPEVAFVGCVGVGVSASGVEYFDEPALVVMLAPLPRERFRVFSGVAPLVGFDAYTAMVHADARATDLPDLIDELSHRTRTGYLFGGLASSRTRTVFLADGVFSGGLSGVAFGPEVELISRVTQGCQPIGPVRSVTRAERNIAFELDGKPALDALLGDLGVDESRPREMLPRLRETLVGLVDAKDDALSRGGQFGVDTRVRHLIGIDPGSRGIAVADQVEAGLQLAFCRRDVNAARRDLVRICTEIRDELEARAMEPSHADQPVTSPGTAAAAGAGTPLQPAPVLGALYVSCAGRGGPHFGAPSAELAVVRQALGDVPLAGFFAGGEIARHHVYGYTGVLTVFTG